MNTNYDNSLNFNGIRYNLYSIDALKKKIALKNEFDEAEETLKKTKFWDLVVDEEGYKAYSKQYKKTYSLDCKPKKHAPNSLIIRAKDEGSKYNRASSFRVDFDNRTEVLSAYNKIKHSDGLKRGVYIVQLLEKQAEKLYYNKIIK